MLGHHLNRVAAGASKLFPTGTILYTDSFQEPLSPMDGNSPTGTYLLDDTWHRVYVTGAGYAYNLTSGDGYATMSGTNTTSENEHLLVDMGQNIIEVRSFMLEGANSKTGIAMFGDHTTNTYLYLGPLWGANGSDIGWGYMPIINGVWGTWTNLYTYAPYTNWSSFPEWKCWRHYGDGNMGVVIKANGGADAATFNMATLLGDDWDLFKDNTEVGMVFGNAKATSSYPATQIYDYNVRVL